MLNKRSKARPCLLFNVYVDYQISSFEISEIFDIYIFCSISRFIKVIKDGLYVILEIEYISDSF
jgi:hypothetical protein